MSNEALVSGRTILPARHLIAAVLQHDSPDNPETRRMVADLRDDDMLRGVIIQLAFIAAGRAKQHFGGSREDALRNEQMFIRLQYDELFDEMVGQHHEVLRGE
jgi:hypothetical protein